jgi:DNA mismatch repair ATPase MutS
MISKNINPLYAILNKTAPEVDTLYDSIHWIETVSFHSGLLQKLQQLLKPGNRSSTAAIRQLNKILERFDVRLNPMVFIPLNIFVFWDLQQAFALEKWKSANKANLTVWFSVLGQIECISTLSAIAFNHPEWSFPALSSEPGTLTAAGMGHPLIESSKRVTNSFSTHGVNQLALITGSNMAGKSTFLRSIGINVVLAMMGAPVCAQSFSVHRMKIMSSMRIADNLEENTSTFYAELKKLKDIIEAVNRSEPVYILLDEILRGTNSLDRHTGSKALIRQLIHHKAVGMIATHDIELAKLAEEFAQNIHNYYFDVQVEHDELYFDYRLKEGICQSMNASILMKKIGIEL